MVPYNFLEKKAAYLNTGVWAKKAMKEAKGFGEVVEVASSAEATYTYIPKDYTIPVDADYFHITTNNTIYGTELKKDLDFLTSDLRFQIHLYLWWCAEEFGSRRCYICYRKE